LHAIPFADFFALRSPSFIRYFVLELLPGGEFFNYLQSAGKLSEDKSRFYSAAVVLALGELHRNKIAYRDLKPENMVSGQQRTSRDGLRSPS
jgi:serine/threonine protein kinase